MGFNDDTRAFLSIPARHDVARRKDAGYLARLVAEHQIDEDEAGTGAGANRWSGKKGVQALECSENFRDSTALNAAFLAILASTLRYARAVSVIDSG